MANADAQGTAADGSSGSSSGAVPVRGGPARRLALGAVVWLLGGLALAAPFVAGKVAPFVLGLLMVAAGVLEAVRAFAVRDRRLGNSTFLGSAMSVLGGFLLLVAPRLALGALPLLLGLSFLLGGLGKIVAGLRSRGTLGWGAALCDGLLNVFLGLLIACQWPVSGIVSIGVAAGLRTLSLGWSILLGRATVTAVPEADAAQTHPDRRLGLPPHPEIAALRETLTAEDNARRRTDRYWRGMFLLTFFAIHVGRMDAEWNLVGLLSPAVAVVGDVFFALVLAWGVVLPLRLGWRRLTRPLERWAWKRTLARADKGRGPGVRGGVTGWWLTRRMRFSLRVSQARRSPTVALGRGLQVGLPLAAILIALNPIWGLSWFFNTENWVAGAWERWAEYRTDAWREQMVRAVQEQYRGKVAKADLFRLSPDGVGGGGDFSFLVIGDPGEGGPAQHALRDQFLLLGQRPEVKFLVVSSDVIYPAGAMKDYEPNFYLPFKGFTRPVYAIPGNHDWYDALEGFTANFFEPEAARVALRARVAADRGLTTTTENRIEQLIEEAAFLREAYGVRAAGQRAPYFEIQTDRFALLAADTGILRTMDDDQLRWLGAALDRARGKFRMVILGHPLYAAGRYQADGEEAFAAVHRLLREHEVEVVMAGDTHCFEYYKETYPARGTDRPMHHFVNGGGGAYLSIGTALDWPRAPPVADTAFYPRTDAVVAQLNRQTPAWKQPLWFWVHRLGAWPSSPEGMAGAFSNNRAPFFQSFVEVRVERSSGVVRLLLYGVNGRLRWRDLQVNGRVVPDGQGEDALVEFRFPLPAAQAMPGP